MPGIYLHVLLAELTLPLYKNPSLEHLLFTGRDFLIAGSVAPDLPYASISDDDLIINNHTQLGDRLHQEKTNEIILQSFCFLKNNFNKLSQKETAAVFSFFTGYITHFLADCILHPFIRDKAGNYEENKEAHRVLEMNLDVAVFYFLSAKLGNPENLNSTHFIDRLLNIQKYKEAASVFKILAYLLNRIFNEKIKPDEISDWISGLYRILNVVSGPHASLLNKTGLFKGILYPDFSDLKNQLEEIFTLCKPVDCNTNFSGKEKINFIDDCIPRFYKIAIDLITNAYNYIFNNGERLTETFIPPVNLDTGRLISENKLDKIPFFWKKED